MTPEIQQKIIELIGLDIDKITSQRDELKAENERLQKALDAAEKVVEAARELLRTVQTQWPESQALGLTALGSTASWKSTITALRIVGGFLSPVGTNLREALAEYDKLKEEK